MSATASSNRLKSPDELLKVMGKATTPTPEPAEDELFCVGFMHSMGARGEKIPVKVFATNDVALSKAAFQEANPSPQKIHAALLCVNGDAAVVVETWNRLYKTAKIEKAPGWFTVSKLEIDEFVKSVTANVNFMAVSEAKAKKPRTKKTATVVTTEIV